MSDFVDDMLTLFYCFLHRRSITMSEGDTGCLPHLWNRVKEKGYAVVVVAEGAGEELLGESTEVDASGNKKLPQIGEYMKKVIADYFKKRGEDATVK